CLFQCFFGSPVGNTVRRSDDRLSAMMRFDLNLYGFGGYTFKMLYKQLCDPLGILVRHETHGDLGECLGRQHGLGSFTNVPAPDTIYFQCWADACMFDRGITFFAPKFLYTEICLIFFD